MKKSAKTAGIAFLCSLLVIAVIYCCNHGNVIEKSVFTDTDEDVLKTSETLCEQAENALINQSVVQQLSITDNQTVSIQKSGVYLLSDSAENCSVSIDTDGTVILLLSNVRLSNEDDAVINVINAEHVLIYSIENTENSLTSGTAVEIVENETDASGAAVYSKDDLTLAGKGTTHIYGYINNGAASTDNLVVLGGTWDIQAVNNGLKGKDSLTVKDGTITILAGNDGMTANNEEDENLGNLYILGGTINIDSYGDAVSAITALSVQGGDITLSTADYTVATQEAANDPLTNMPQFDSMTPPDQSGFGSSQDGEAPDTVTSPTQNTDSSESEQSTQRPDRPQSGQMTPPGQSGFGSSQDGEAPDAVTSPTQNTDSSASGQSTQRPNRPQSGQMTPPDSSDIQFGAQPSAADTETSASVDTQDSISFSGFSFNMSGKVGGFDDGNPNKNEGNSSKGLKSDGILEISDANIHISTKDDAIHAADVTINSGIITIETDDDGIHADNILIINDGTIDITNSYEAVEGHEIYIYGGTIDTVSTDDGFNASGTVGCALVIYNGTIHVNANGDGLDSNGNLIIEGGSVIVDGPTNAGNGALDSGSENGGSLLINGGELIAIGAQGMDESFEDSSGQCSLRCVTQTCQAGTLIQIKDESGNLLYEYTSQKSFSSIVYSSDQLKENGTYTVTAGTESYTITLDGVTGSNSSSSGGFSGFGKGFGWNTPNS